MNFGEDGENICLRSILKDVLEDFYDVDFEEEENVIFVKKGCLWKFKLVEEFFIVLCCLRRGFFECYLVYLYGVV